MGGGGQQTTVNPAPRPDFANEITQPRPVVHAPSRGRSRAAVAESCAVVTETMWLQSRSCFLWPLTGNVGKPPPSVLCTDAQPNSHTHVSRCAQIRRCTGARRLARAVQAGAQRRRHTPRCACSHTHTGDTHGWQACAGSCRRTDVGTCSETRKQAREGLRQSLMETEVSFLAAGPCPHPPRPSQTHSGTLSGTHGRGNTDPQTHRPPHRAITRPSPLCPVSLNLLVPVHCSLSPSQPQISPQILSPSESLISLPRKSLLLSLHLCMSLPCGLTSTRLRVCFLAPWSSSLCDCIFLPLRFLVSSPPCLSLSLRPHLCPPPRV